MKSMIITFMAIFVWTMMPIEAIADRGDRISKHNRRTAVNYEQNRYDRHEKRHDRYEKRHNIKREHRKHHRQARRQRVEYRYLRPRAEQITYPIYSSYGIPSGYVYTSSPGISLYFSW